MDVDAVVKAEYHALLHEGAQRSRPLRTRGTTNQNVRGNAEDRRRRRLYLVETYRANYDYDPAGTGWAGSALGWGIPACRCYRCGALLTVETVTVDRIIPGCRGGTYRRNNIRPACGPCNSETGARVRRKD